MQGSLEQTKTDILQNTQLYLRFTSTRQSTYTVRTEKRVPICNPEHILKNFRLKGITASNNAIVQHF